MSRDFRFIPPMNKTPPASNSFLHYPFLAIRTFNLSPMGYHRGIPPYPPCIDAWHAKNARPAPRGRPGKAPLRGDCFFSARFFFLFLFFLKILRHPCRLGLFKKNTRRRRNKKKLVRKQNVTKQHRACMIEDHAGGGGGGIRIPALFFLARGMLFFLPTPLQPCVGGIFFLAPFFLFVGCERARTLATLAYFLKIPSDIVGFFPTTTTLHGKKQAGIF